MPRVICNLPNASAEINGVKFHPLEDGGMVSDEIDNEKAAGFLEIAGYESWDNPAPAAALLKPSAPPAPKTRKSAKKTEVHAAPEAPAVPEQPVDTQQEEESADRAPEAPADGEGAGEVF